MIKAYEEVLRKALGMLRQGWVPEVEARDAQGEVVVGDQLHRAASWNLLGAIPIATERTPKAKGYWEDAALLVHDRIRRLEGLGPDHLLNMMVDRWRVLREEGDETRYNEDGVDRALNVRFFINRFLQDDLDQWQNVPGRTQAEVVALVESALQG